MRHKPTAAKIKTNREPGIPNRCERSIYIMEERKQLEE